MNRRMVTIIGIAGAIVGIPAVAFALSFIFATIEGETTLTDSAARVTILSASGTSSDTLDCTKTEGKGARFTINPIGRRVTAGDKTTVKLGTCVITVELRNTGDVLIDLPQAEITMPPGWTVSRSRSGPIPAGGDGSLSFTLGSTTTAAAGKISGYLTADTA